MAFPFMLLAGLAGTALSVAGTLRGASDEKEAAEFEAGQAELAANRSDRNAALTEAQYDEALRREGISNRLALGSIRAAFGASGVTLQGSPQAYIEMNEAIAKDNEIAIRHQGVIRARALREQASSYRDRARQMRRTGKRISDSGDIAAIGTAALGVTESLTRVASFGGKGKR